MLLCVLPFHLQVCDTLFVLYFSYDSPVVYTSTWAAACLCVCCSAHQFLFPFVITTIPLWSCSHKAQCDCYRVVQLCLLWMHACSKGGFSPSFDSYIVALLYTASLIVAYSTAYARRTMKEMLLSVLEVKLNIEVWTVHLEWFFNERFKGCVYPSCRVLKSDYIINKLRNNDIISWRGSDTIFYCWQLLINPWKLSGFCDLLPTTGQIIVQSVTVWTGNLSTVNLSTRRFLKQSARYYCWKGKGQMCCSLLLCHSL